MMKGMGSFMVIYSFKVSPKKLILAALAVILAVVLILCGKMLSKTPARAAAFTGGADDTERVEFLKRFGWETEKSPVEIKEIIIPEVFDEVFEAYNQIQISQGFNLAAYKGKRVKRFTYSVNNYPGGAADVRANLIIYNNAVIGGDISTAALDGFMHGFKADGVEPAPGLKP